ncbi:hypothetical protein VPH35_113552 [Triticum aestivum]
MYEMEALSDLHSKRLFFKKIFGSEDYCPHVLKGIANKIPKKCGGLPLSIISISSLLANILMVKDEWERVEASRPGQSAQRHDSTSCSSCVPPSRSNEKQAPPSAPASGTCPPGTAK